MRCCLCNRHETNSNPGAGCPFYPNLRAAQSATVTNTSVAQPHIVCLILDPNGRHLNVLGIPSLTGVLWLFLRKLFKQIQWHSHKPNPFKTIALQLDLH